MILYGPDVSIDVKLRTDPDGDTNSQSCGAMLRAAPTSRVSQTPLDQLTRSSTSSVAVLPLITPCIMAPRSNFRFSAGSDPFVRQRDPGLFSGLFDRQDAMAANAEPPAPAVGIGAAGLGSQPKAGQLPIPEEAVASLRLRRVNRTFSKLCHGWDRVSIR